VGLAVTVTLRAIASGKRTGAWIGGLFMSPAAPRVELPARLAPGTPFSIALTTPTPKALAYLEIDDARGRAWATSPALAPFDRGTARAEVTAPGLAPGLYHAIGGTDPAGAAGLGAGTISVPFFVAPNDEAALALAHPPGSETACSVPRDPREAATALGACLALAPIQPLARWTALDGFSQQRELDRQARQRGLTIALGGLIVAIALEGILLLRAGSRSGAVAVAVAVLVGLLGFALLAAFLVRV
jgi:hypothetical protein